MYNRRSSAWSWLLFATMFVTPARASDSTERAQLTSAIAKTVEAEYVFPEIAAKMAATLRDREGRGDYAHIAEDRALADKLTQDLRSVSHDLHLRVEFDPEGTHTDPETASLDDLERWRKGSAHRNFGFAKVEHMEGNVGYLDFRAFLEPYLAANVANAAMAFVANSDALVIDLRENRGGDPAMVAFLASFLFDDRTRLNDIYIRAGDRLEQYWTTQLPPPIFGGKKPLYVLTSKQTFSGAEDFAYALQNLKRATIVGETTGGGAHPTRMFKVTEHFAVEVPFARSVSPITRTDWEGSGVKPNMAVPARDALRVAYRAAIQQLVSSAPDPARRHALEALLASGKELHP